MCSICVLTVPAVALLLPLLRSFYHRTLILYPYHLFQLVPAGTQNHMMKFFFHPVAGTFSSCTSASDCILVNYHCTGRNSFPAARACPYPELYPCRYFCFFKSPVFSSVFSCTHLTLGTARAFYFSVFCPLRKKGKDFASIESAPTNSAGLDGRGQFVLEDFAFDSTVVLYLKNTRTTLFGSPVLTATHDYGADCSRTLP